ncbi:FK506-binding protein 5-like [Microplitis mediator]|uniref:FK506-binding protein 5-like n=1 Tax=Microplitis mediator TaxID=375433 RepID=UPI002555810D|nr:FK506-binding protein 5-like [Microplitis mediator]
MTAAVLFLLLFTTVWANPFFFPDEFDALRNDQRQYNGRRSYDLNGQYDSPINQRYDRNNYGGNSQAQAEAQANSDGAFSNARGNAQSHNNGGYSNAQAGAQANSQNGYSNARGNAQSGGSGGYSNAETRAEASGNGFGGSNAQAMSNSYNNNGYNRYNPYDSSSSSSAAAFAGLDRYGRPVASAGAGAANARPDGLSSALATALATGQNNNNNYGNNPYYERPGIGPGYGNYDYFRSRSGGDEDDVDPKNGTALEAGKKGDAGSDKETVSEIKPALSNSTSTTEQNDSIVFD